MKVIKIGSGLGLEVLQKMPHAERDLGKGRAVKAWM